jgi:eukaryotic-like serine/threonine-protein kinase
MAAPLQFVGQKLSHYRIIEQIGAGGMGVVYRAHDEQLERDVALKVLPVGTLADEAARKRFRKEALALAKLNHPNIATIFEFSSQNSTDYLVTEYISGQTLDAKLATRTLSEKEVVSLGIQLAQGLSAAHEQGIVHRDLKPANLRLTSDGRLKILDFGLAQLMPHASDLGVTATMTKLQEVTGTLPYMAPEQLRGDPAEEGTDIWAAGVVLYEMATAHRPFEAKVPTALAGDIIHKAPPPPRRLRSELSPKLEAVILKCLEKEQAKRYRSAHELQSDLERLGTGVAPLAVRPRSWPSIVTITIVVAVLAIGAFFYAHRTTALTEKDTIVLAEFANTTGDPVFDGTLRQGLSSQLEQSPFLNLLSDERIAQTLSLMAQPKDTRLTHELAREVCRRTASAVVLDGSIVQIGTQYLLTLKAVNCSNGESLASTGTQASDKNHILGALSKAATEMRSKLGESQSTVQNFDVPLERATTPSLEALEAYSMGVEMFWGKGEHAAAVPFFQRAISLDPHFSMAYAVLGTVYGVLGETSLEVENTKKAYELRDSVSDLEKFYIDSHYYEYVIGNIEKSRQVYELWAQTYPRDQGSRNNLGLIYRDLGQYDQALAEFREGLRLAPESAISYFNLANAYLALGRLQEARETFEHAEAKKLDSPWLRIYRYQLAFLQNDAIGMRRQVAWSLGKPGVEDMFLNLEAVTAAYFGHIRKAREFSRQAVDSAERADQKETAATYEADAALREALFGNATEARHRAAASLQLSTGPNVQYETALALAFAGDAMGAEHLANDLGRQYPENIRVQFERLPTIHALLALDRKNVAKAMQALQSAPNEAGDFSRVYVRGEAFLASHRGSEAAAEFQKILDHQGIVLNEPIGALAHLGLARAYVLQGNTAKMHAAYQDFFALWKDADPDIPILKEAKAEYAKRALSSALSRRVQVPLALK